MSRYINNEFWYQLRFALPLWLIRAVSDWWPDNRVTISIRGKLYRIVLRNCGKGFTAGRDISLAAVDRLEIGNNVYLAKGCWLNAIGGLKIGDEVVMAPYVVISTNKHGFRDGSVRFGGAHPCPVEIGRGTWLAAHSVVAGGVTIGCGNLIGANAVVTKNTPNHVIVGGVPAVVIGPRTDNPSEINSRAEVTAG
jgi:acetyltransferase-like isoleucine patch superfamily enzyme